MSGFGVDPSTMAPVEMPQQEAMPGEAAMDGGMEGQAEPPHGPAGADPYAGVGEFDTRERVELCLLLSIERAAKGVDAGMGAENPQFAAQYGQAAASLSQAYAALAGAERAESAPKPPVPPN